jgi:hypothetical protein
MPTGVQMTFEVQTDKVIAGIDENLRLDKGEMSGQVQNS